MVEPAAGLIESRLVSASLGGEAEVEARARFPQGDLLQDAVLVDIAMLPGAGEAAVPVGAASKVADGQDHDQPAGDGSWIDAASCGSPLLKIGRAHV